MGIWLNGKEAITASTITGDSGDFADYVASGSGTPGTIDKSGGDGYFTDDIEVDGIVYMDGGGNVSGGVFEMGSKRSLILGGTTNDLVIYGNRDTDEACVQLGTQIGKQLVISSTYLFKDFDHAAPTNPTVYIHSDTDPDTDNTQWVGLSHDQTDAVTGIGAGSKVTHHEAPVSLADDASFNLPDASVGFGMFVIGDNQEYAQIAWDASGNTTLIANSANVVTTDTDMKLCFVTTGTQIAVKNRLDSALEVIFDYHYTT